MRFAGRSTTVEVKRAEDDVSLRIGVTVAALPHARRLFRSVRNLILGFGCVDVVRVGLPV
jgi:hypothetical protein